MPCNLSIQHCTSEKRMLDRTSKSYDERLLLCHQMLKSMIFQSPDTNI